MTRTPTLCVGYLILVGGLTGCGDRGPKPAALTQEKPKTEANLVFISLKAVDSLQIHSKAFPAEAVQEYLPLTGWITAKQGNEVTLTSPVAGYVHASPKYKGGSSFPRQGDEVSKKHEVLTLEPVLAPLEHIQKEALRFDFQSDLIKATETEANAKKELARIKALRADNLSSKQELEQGELRYAIALASLKAAQDKNMLFQIPHRSIIAPLSGQVMMVHAGPGQYVPAAAPLLTIVDLIPIWIRVSVPESDLPQVNIKDEAPVFLKNAVLTGADAKKSPKPHRLMAKPLGLVPQVDRDKHTADMLYQLTKDDDDPTIFVKDLMVSVHVPLGRMRKDTVVPYSALQYDTLGGAWIYLDRGKADGQHKFERRRVEVGANVPGGVIIRPTLKNDDMVVINEGGPAFLYSREFHSTPVPMADK